MTRWYFESQAAGESWRPSPFPVPDPSVAGAMQKTAGHTLWVTTMPAALAGRDRPRR